MRDFVCFFIFFFMTAILKFWIIKIILKSSRDMVKIYPMTIFWDIKEVDNIIIILIQHYHANESLHKITESYIGLCH